MLCTTSTQIHSKPLHPRTAAAKQMRKKIQASSSVLILDEIRLKQLLPTGVLELIQPIFAAAWRALQGEQSSYFFPLISSCKSVPHWSKASVTLLIYGGSAGFRCEAAARCLAQTAGVTPRAGGSSAITSAPGFLSLICSSPASHPWKSTWRIISAKIRCFSSQILQLSVSASSSISFTSPVEGSSPAVQHHSRWTALWQVAAAAWVFYGGSEAAAQAGVPPPRVHALAQILGPCAPCARS